jgi:hypothetical protein
MGASEALAQEQGFFRNEVSSETRFLLKRGFFRNEVSPATGFIPYSASPVAFSQGSSPEWSSPEVSLFLIDY